MIKINSILAAFFVILLVIIVGEVGYYFFYKPSKPNVPQNNQVLNQKVNKPTPTPAIPPALDRQVLGFLARYKKGGISSATADLEIKGTVVKINTKGGTFNLGYKPGDKFVYKVMLIIKKENGTTSTIAYNENDLKNVRVMDNTQKPFNVNNLKVGDKIIIHSKIDLLKDKNNNTIEEIITKI